MIKKIKRERQTDKTNIENWSVFRFKRVCMYTYTRVYVYQKEYVNWSSRFSVFRVCCDPGNCFHGEVTSEPSFFIFIFLFCFKRNGYRLVDGTDKDFYTLVDTRRFFFAISKSDNRKQKYSNAFGFEYLEIFAENYESVLLHSRKYALGNSLQLLLITIN